MTALNFLRHGLIVLALLVASCGSDSGATTAPPAEPLELTATTPGFDLGSVDGEYFEAISYGPYEENLFDIYLPASDEPTPLLVYIHGGGFTGGSRDTTDDEAFVMSYLSEGVAFAEYGLDLLELADALGLAQALLDFYGITDVEDFDSPEIIEYRARVDMLDLMDAEDPPFYAQNDLEPAGPNAPPLTVNLAFHHANHALVLAEKADEIGLENVVYIKGLMIEDPSGEDSLGFALRHFGL